MVNRAFDRIKRLALLWMMPLYDQIQYTQFKISLYFFIVLATILWQQILGALNLLCFASDWRHIETNALCMSLIKTCTDMWMLSSVRKRLHIKTPRMHFSYYKKEIIQNSVVSMSSDIHVHPCPCNSPVSIVIIIHSTF